MHFHSSSSMKIYFYRQPGISYPHGSSNLNASPVLQWKHVVFVCTAANILEADKIAKNHGHDAQKLLCSIENVFLPVVDPSKLLWFLLFVKES